MAARPQEVQTREGPIPSRVPVESVYAAVESGLAEVLPGLSVLDRDLELGGEVVANLVLADAQGRLTLVLLADGDANGIVLAALDALRFARDNQEILLRHLEFDELAASMSPRVLLIADDFDDATVGRLEPLLEREVRLFAVRTLKSAAGERAYLRPVRAHGAPSPAERIDPLRFVASLPEDVQGIADTVRLRLGRIDGQLQARGSREQLLWQLGTRVLARMAWTDGRLQGFVPPQTRPIAIRTEVDIDHFVDAVLGSYIESAGVELIPESGADLESDEPPAGLMPEITLTAEELEAFHD